MSTELNTAKLTGKSIVPARRRQKRPRVLRPVSDATPDPRAFKHVVPELHNPRSGRLDARRIAEYYDLEMKTIAALLGQKLTTVSKTSDSKPLQPGLADFGRIAAALQHLVGSEQNRRIWLSAPNPQLGGKTPAQAITEGDAGIVVELLENMLVGQPA